MPVARSPEAALLETELEVLGAADVLDLPEAVNVAVVPVEVVGVIESLGDGDSVDSENEIKDGINGVVGLGIGVGSPGSRASVVYIYDIYISLIRVTQV